MFAIDTETERIEGDVPALVSVAIASDNHVAMRPFATRARIARKMNGYAVVLFAWDDPGLADALRAVIESGEPLVLQNAAFDWLVLEKAGVVPYDLLVAGIDRTHDTMLRERLLQIAWGDESPVNLAELVAHYLNENISESKTGKDTWRLRYGELRNTPLKAWPEEAIEYAMRDAELTARVYEQQKKRWLYNWGPAFPDEQLQVRANVALQASAFHGVRVDATKVEVLDAALQDAIDAKQKASEEAGILRINKCKVCDGTGKVGAVPALEVCPVCAGDPAFLPPRARVPLAHPTQHTARLKEWIAVLGSPKILESGEIQTDAESIESIQHPAFDEYRAGKKAEKVRSTYVSAFREGSILRPRIDSLRKTGRTSYSSPNLQNLPRQPGVRECIIPREGMVFAACDYVGAELVTLASILGPQSQLAKALNQGLDYHSLIAAQMNGSTYETVYAHRDEEPYKGWRTAAKPANFGLAGGMGPTAFVQYAKGYGKTLTVAEASELIAAWKKLNPEVGARLNSIALQLAQAPGGLITVRQPASGRIRGGCSYSDAANTAFQGLAADAAKHALWLHWCASRDTISPLHGTNLAVFVHDELIVEGPSHTAHLWAPELRRLMLLSMNEYAPGVRADADLALMTEWTKAAKAQYDADGHLIPYAKKVG